MVVHSNIVRIGHRNMKGCINGCNSSKLSTSDDVFHSSEQRVVAIVECIHQHQALIFSQLIHFSRFVCVTGKGLLAKDMFACVQGGNGPWMVGGNMEWIVQSIDFFMANNIKVAVAHSSYVVGCRKGVSLIPVSCCNNGDMSQRLIHARIDKCCRSYAGRAQYTESNHVFVFCLLAN